MRKNKGNTKSPNSYYIENNKVYMELNSDKITIFDIDDLYILDSIHRWGASKHGDRYYAHSSRTIEKKRITYCLHRLITTCPEGMYVDHINGDTLDNTKSNLRICTNKENCRNTKLSKNSTSGYKGVSCYKKDRNKKWIAKIMVDYKTINLGYFWTKEEAAYAYNLAAVKYHGDFARLNIITKID